MIAGLAETGFADPRPPVLVLSVGNQLLRDDGVGVELLAELAHDIDPCTVEFVDGGTQGLALLSVIGGRRSVLVLDAIALGAAPGTVHVLRDEAAREARPPRATSAHEGNAGDLLSVAELLGERPEQVVILGVEPGLVETGIGLSPAVSRALPEAVRQARGVLAELLGENQR